MASDLCVSAGVEAPGRVGPRDGAASVNVIHVAKLLTRTEERLLDTERGLIEAVRRTIHVTEGMIALVRSTTATTHALMLPHGDGGYLGACRGPGECTQASLHCACQRVAMAKDLVRVVEGLNRTAGRVNEATDCLIKLSNRLSPREPLTETCTDYLMERVVAAEGAARSITQVDLQATAVRTESVTYSRATRCCGPTRQVQSSLQLRVHTLGVAAEALCSRGLGPGVEATPERDRAVQDLRSMMDSASTAVAELTATADTLQDSAQFLRGVVRELIALQVTQVG
ncbi:uncharacterized protein LOC113204110 [Frankliniella occidentalis]|uniref:Uncharacterized protein LOC113204110 n=1 Tax=Frankliniella occidentalis TaxID=133901 RepID=A0A9C6X143_FRAOC|nr:uncharacterized protein LOC113204110 [Frankliniella occidentalis]